MTNNGSSDGYRRYHIETSPAPDIVPWPSPFLVRVRRLGLAKLLVKELIEYRGDLDVVLSRPCVYGVFSGPAGGFFPRQRLCVGCLRCTVQYPEFVSVLPNPERQRLGDSYFDVRYVNAVAYEAQTGRIPVKGAGYRGEFGGDGWDGVWTDMSEIVRPTRDGIHGREFISTDVDIGSKPGFLSFSSDGQPIGPVPRTFRIPLPILFDTPVPGSAPGTLTTVLARAAREVSALAILPVESLVDRQLSGEHVVPLVAPANVQFLERIAYVPRMIELDGWNESLFRTLCDGFSETQICLRVPFAETERLVEFVDAGVSVFHLTADYHGRGEGGQFVYDLIRSAHMALVDAGLRDQVTLLGSGGIIAAEHVPKAIIAGLDAVVLDSPLLVALQARFEGEFTGREACRHQLPAFPVEWGVQRLKNLVASWRDQLLEVLGAMGLREVRRLRGEIGRAMLQKELEREAFAGIEGYSD